MTPRLAMGAGVMAPGELFYGRDWLASPSPDRRRHLKSDFRRKRYPDR